MLSLTLALAVLASSPQPSSGAAQAKPAAGEKKVETGDCHHPPAPTAAQAKNEDWVLHRGEKIAEGKTLPVKQLLADASKLDGKTVIVEGTVRKACERKGCWMELAVDGDKTGAGVRVTFKDYGFFVPLDSAGSKARVAGAVKLAQLSEERAQHYESEGALVPRDAAGTPREVQLVATGVELRR